jgi:nucleoside-diphosphate-sugar epimerase
MRVCVTGGTGLIGGALVRRLLDERVPVRVLARSSPGADHLERSGAQIVRGDVGDSEAIARAVHGIDVVYHAAARVGGGGARARFIDTNVGGTERVLVESLRHGVGRVVYASSLAVYGQVRGGQPIDEGTPFDNAPEARDFYSQSKILADEWTAAFAARTGLPVTIVRPGIVYGRGRPLPVGLLGFRLARTAVVFGNRQHRIPLCYVENLVDAMMSASTVPGAFNLVDDENLTLGEYHETAARVVKGHAVFVPGWPVLLAAPLVPGLSRYQVTRALQDRRYLTGRIRAETGWTPRVPLREALERSIL